jgi:protein phosphatase 1 regulatory subunit 37
VLALSVSVKMNNTLRCLDLNIPANDPDFARLSQEILQWCVASLPSFTAITDILDSRSCVRNTEIAQEESLARGNKATIAAPILKSVVARDLKTRQENEDRERRNAESASKSKDDILLAADECRVVLGDLLAFDVAAKERGVIVAPSEVVRDLLVRPVSFDPSRQEG